MNIEFKKKKSEYEPVINTFNDYIHYRIDEYQKKNQNHIELRESTCEKCNLRKDKYCTGFCCGKVKLISSLVFCPLNKWK